MSELKPCPFCGGEATMYYWRKMGTEFMQWGRVRCTNDYCAMSGVDWSDIRGETRHETNREEDAIKRWNTRAPTEETARADAKCLWAQDIDGYWETSCGEAHIFEEGTPSQNSHDFCPYCGKHLEEQTP